MLRLSDILEEGDLINAADLAVSFYFAIVIKLYVVSKIPGQTYAPNSQPGHKCVKRLKSELSRVCILGSVYCDV